MSARHPIIAITGSSGAGTTTVKTTFQQIFRREGVAAAIIEGDAFHRYDRTEMRAKMAEEQKPGTFTAWEDLPSGTELLFYEGLHGAVKTDKVDVARHADLLIGVVPIINLEWIQKLHRDRDARGQSQEAIVD